MISAHIWNKIYHLTWIALPHYHVKYDEVQKFAMFYLLSCNDKGVTVVRIQFANSNTYYDKDVTVVRIHFANSNAYQSVWWSKTVGWDSLDMLN